jgi:hypothetical protein
MFFYLHNTCIDFLFKHSIVNHTYMMSENYLFGSLNQNSLINQDIMLTQLLKIIHVWLPGFVVIFLSKGKLELINVKMLLYLSSLCYSVLKIMAVMMLLLSETLIYSSYCSALPSINLLTNECYSN